MSNRQRGFLNTEFQALACEARRLYGQIEAEEKALADGSLAQDMQRHLVLYWTDGRSDTPDFAFQGTQRVHAGKVKVSVETVQRAKEATVHLDHVLSALQDVQSRVRAAHGVVADRMLSFRSADALKPAAQAAVLGLPFGSPLAPALVQPR